MAAYGFEAGVCAREDSMCAISIVEPETVVVRDATLDARFARNPFVTGEIDDVRFYASAHLRDRDGHVLGSLCVFDQGRTTSPRSSARAWTSWPAWSWT